jgi:hypothetical protein
VVIVDTSNEIGGDGDVPHPAIGNARRMQVADATRQHDVMVGGGVLPAGHPCCAVLLLLRCILRLTWSCMPVAALSIGWNPDAVLLVVLADAAVFASSNLASTAAVWDRAVPWSVLLGCSVLTPRTVHPCVAD